MPSLARNWEAIGATSARLYAGEELVEEILAIYARRPAPNPTGTVEDPLCGPGPRRA
jgi:hypothetical protein